LPFQGVSKLKLAGAFDLGHFFEFILRNFEKSEMSKLLLMNKNINSYVP